MRPGSQTHHIDFDQRYVELKQMTDTEAANTLTFVAPAADEKYLLRGYYMMFVVTNGGVPSAATWVLVQ